MTNCGDSINCDLGGFKFTKEVAEHFDEHIRKSVPLYDQIQKLVVDMSFWFVQNNTAIVDFGCSLGHTLKLLYDAHRRNKLVFCYGIDSSEEMINAAKSRYEDLDSASNNMMFIQHDLHKGIPLLQERTDPISYATMLYTLQFIQPSKRDALLSQIHNQLVYDGALVIVDKVIGNSAKFNEMWIQLHHDLKRANGLSWEEVKAKEQALRGIIFPSTVRENLEALQSAGFSDIDIFFKWANFMGVIATK